MSLPSPTAPIPFDPHAARAGPGGPISAGQLSALSESSAESLGDAAALADVLTRVSLAPHAGTRRDGTPPGTQASILSPLGDATGVPGTAGLDSGPGAGWGPGPVAGGPVGGGGGGTPPLPDAGDGRKIVVLGVPWQTEEASLAAHFERFGAVEEATIMRERHSGKSRGFGFVTYADAAGAAAACAAADHVIDGRRCEAKPALPEGRVGSARTTRIFVARIPSSVTDAGFRAYFERWGPVQDAYMPKDPSKAAHRGIGFVTFAAAEAVDAVMAQTHVLGGNEVAIDRATPKDRGAGGAQVGGAHAVAAAAAAAAALLPGRLCMSQPNLAALGAALGPHAAAAATVHGGSAVAEYLRALQSQIGVGMQAGGAGGGAGGSAGGGGYVVAAGAGQTTSPPPALRRRANTGQAPAPLGVEVSSGSATLLSPSTSFHSGMLSPGQATPPPSARRAASSAALAGGAGSGTPPTPTHRGGLGMAGSGGAPGPGSLASLPDLLAFASGDAGAPGSAEGLQAMLAHAAYHAQLASSASLGSLPGLHRDLSNPSLHGGAGEAVGASLRPGGYGAGSSAGARGGGRVRAGAGYRGASGPLDVGSFAPGSLPGTLPGLDAFGSGAPSMGPGSLHATSADLARTLSDALAAGWPGIAGTPGNSAHGGGALAGLAGLAVSAAGGATQQPAQQQQQQLPGHPAAQASHGPASARAGPRIFVGKLGRDTSEGDVKEYFSAFGYVLDVYLPRDRANKREHRGFGFVTFETEAAIQRVVAHGAHQIRGAYVAIDAAVPRQEEIVVPTPAMPAPAYSSTSPPAGDDTFAFSLDGMNLSGSGGSGLWRR